MSIEKNMNARIQHKHDIEANWNKALNFIPKIGEIIVYDIDDNYNYSRFKIGDGTTVVSSLPFVNDEIRQALTSGATKVSKAETADRATTADSATSAQTAQTAVSAQTADSATVADTALVANSATKATQDGNGKVIADTYETKENVESKIAQALLDSQADWDQTDSSAANFIKNKPDEDDAFALLLEMNLVEPVVDEDGSVYTDENGAMYTIV